MPDATLRHLDQAAAGSGRVLDAQASFGRNRDGFYGLVGDSAAMRAVFRAVERLAPHARATLITGDSGTGKAALAAIAHRLGPCRAGAQLTMLGADDDAERECLRESARGARTAVTCFVPEVADLSADRQAQLVRALCGAADLPVGEGLHVIAATARPVTAPASSAALRRDLYYRLTAVHYHLPTLGERLEDIPDLAALLLREGCRRMKVLDKTLSGAALRVLEERRWPGNVRELQNVMLRAAALTDDTVIGAQTMREACGPAVDAGSAAVRRGASAGAQLDPAERQRVTSTLAAVGGNKSAAAVQLGVSRRAFYRLLDRLGA